MNKLISYLFLKNICLIQYIYICNDYKCNFRYNILYTVVVMLLFSNSSDVQIKNRRWFFNKLLNIFTILYAVLLCLQYIFLFVY